MHLTVDGSFRLALYRAEIEARGAWGRFRELTDARLADGLDDDDAELDAAESMGLADELENALQEALSAFESPELDDVSVSDARAGMPMLRRDDRAATLELPTGPFSQLRSLTRVLAEAFVDDPDRIAATVAVGLGGTGGCAAGECLPEDAPPGPLFESR